MIYINYLKKNYYQFYVKIKFKIKKVVSNLLKKTNKIKFEKLSPQKSIFPFPMERVQCCK